MYLEKALELIESEIELIKTVILPSGHVRPAQIKSGPSLRWVRSQQALLELATALHGCDSFADEKGDKPTFAALMRVLCRAFNITVNDIYVKRTLLFDRCTDRTPFLNMLIEKYNLIVDEHLK